MGDCCWVQIECLKKDRKVFEDAGFSVEGERGKGGLIMEDDQANYGATDELYGLAHQGIPFLAHGGPGDAYDCFAMAAIGGSVIEVSTDRAFDPVVKVEQDGFINPDAVSTCRSYWDRVRAVEALLASKEDEDE
jgi:hypothetical protein